MLLTIAQWLAIAFPVALLAGPAVAEVLSALMTLLFFVHSATTRDWQWLRSPWVMLLMAMCIMFIVSGFFSADPLTSVHRASLFIRFPLFAAALAFWVLRDERTQQRVLLVMVIAMVALAADMMLEYVRGTDIFGHRRIDMPNFVRLHGPFAKIHPGSTLVWITFPAVFFVLHRIQTRMKPGIKRAGAFLGGLALMGFAVATVHVSGERAAFLTCVMGIGLAILLAKKLRMFFLLLAVLGGLGIAAMAQKEPEMLNMQVTRATNTIAIFQDSVYGRLWMSAWDIAKDHPLLGVGTKRFRHECLDAKYGPVMTERMELRCGTHPHNMYLEILSETGAISLALFLSTLGYWAWLAWQQRVRIMNETVLCGLVIACMIRLWPVATMPSHFTPWFASPLWFIIGMTLARLALPSSTHEKAAR